jgi:hypothetical protein
VLTPLQQRLLGLVSRLPEADGFALAGGAALIMRGTVDRDTNDLDFFIGHADVEADTIATIVAAVERALGEAGMEWRREVTADTFARLTVETDHEECRIDLAVDVRMRPVDRDPGVALLSLEELAADKVLALFGRVAARDYQDVAALRRHFSWTVLLEIASEKDAGCFRRARPWTRSPPSTGSMPSTSIPSRAGYERLRIEGAPWPQQIRSER